MLDLIQKCFGHGQLWPLQPVCSQNWAELCYAKSDFPHPILFRSSVFGKCFVVVCNKFSVFVLVCVCACACGCACVFVRACVRACVCMPAWVCHVTVIIHVVLESVQKTQ